MPKILPQIKHVVVVMFENRSLDNVCGWLYRAPAAPPKYFLPAGGSAHYDGLDSSLWNPRNASYFKGDPPDKIPIMDSATSLTNPNVDPEETFDHVTRQLYGPAGYTSPVQSSMLGFVVDYEYATAGNPVEIMEPFSADQVGVLSALARSYAISDAWFCSVPSQTWPNRAFVYAGTSNGKVNNGDHPNPFAWNAQTIARLCVDTYDSTRRQTSDRRSCRAYAEAHGLVHNRLLIGEHRLYPVRHYAFGFMDHWSHLAGASWRSVKVLPGAQTACRSNRKRPAVCFRTTKRRGDIPATHRPLNDENPTRRAV